MAGRLKKGKRKTRGTGRGTMREPKVKASADTNVELESNSEAGTTTTLTGEDTNSNSHVQEPEGSNISSLGCHTPSTESNHNETLPNPNLEQQIELDSSQSKHPSVEELPEYTFVYPKKETDYSGYSEFCHTLAEDDEEQETQCYYVDPTTRKRCNNICPNSYCRLCKKHMEDAYVDEFDKPNYDKYDNMKGPWIDRQVLAQRIQKYAVNRKRLNSGLPIMDHDKVEPNERLFLDTPKEEEEVDILNDIQPPAEFYNELSTEDNVPKDDGLAHESCDSDVSSVDESCPFPSGERTFTDEESLLWYRNGAIKLQQSYLTEYKDALEELTEIDKIGLIEVKKEIELYGSVELPPFSTWHDEELINTIRAMNKTGKVNTEDGLLLSKTPLPVKLVDGTMLPHRKKQGVKCSHTDGLVRCELKVLPNAKFCVNHIMEDKQQLLFTTCSFNGTSGTCTETIPLSNLSTMCDLHASVPSEIDDFEDLNISLKPSRSSNWDNDIKMDDLIFPPSETNASSELKMDLSQAKITPKKIPKRKMEMPKTYSQLPPSTFEEQIRILRESAPNIQAKWKKIQLEDDRIALEKKRRIASSTMMDTALNPIDIKSESFNALGSSLSSLPSPPPPVITTTVSPFMTPFGSVSLKTSTTFPSSMKRMNGSSKSTIDIPIVNIPRNRTPKCKPTTSVSSTGMAQSSLHSSKGNMTSIGSSNSNTVVIGKTSYLISPINDGGLDCSENPVNVVVSSVKNDNLPSKSSVKRKTLKKGTRNVNSKKRVIKSVNVSSSEASSSNTTSPTFKVPTSLTTVRCLMKNTTMVIPPAFKAMSATGSLMKALPTSVSLVSGGLSLRTVPTTLASVKVSPVVESSSVVAPSQSYSAERVSEVQASKSKKLKYAGPVVGYSSQDNIRNDHDYANKNLMESGDTLQKKEHQIELLQKNMEQFITNMKSQNGDDVDIDPPLRIDYSNYTISQVSSNVENSIRKPTFAEASESKNRFVEEESGLLSSDGRSRNDANDDMKPEFKQVKNSSKRIFNIFEKHGCCDLGQKRKEESDSPDERIVTDDQITEGERLFSEMRYSMDVKKKNFEEGAMTFNVLDSETSIGSRDSTTMIDNLVDVKEVIGDAVFSTPEGSSSDSQRMPVGNPSSSMKGIQRSPTYTTYDVQRNIIKCADDKKKKMAVEDSICNSNDDKFNKLKMAKCSQKVIYENDENDKTTRAGQRKKRKRNNRKTFKRMPPKRTVKSKSYNKPSSQCLKIPIGNLSHLAASGENKIQNNAFLTLDNKECGIFDVVSGISGEHNVFKCREDDSLTSQTIKNYKTTPMQDKSVYTLGKSEVSLSEDDDDKFLGFIQNFDSQSFSLPDDILESTMNIESSGGITASNVKEDNILYNEFSGISDEFSMFIERGGEFNNLLPFPEMDALGLKDDNDDQDFLDINKRDENLFSELTVDVLDELIKNECNSEFMHLPENTQDISVTCGDREIGEVVVLKGIGGRVRELMKEDVGKFVNFQDTVFSQNNSTDFDSFLENSNSKDLFDDDEILALACLKLANETEWNASQFVSENHNNSSESNNLAPYSSTINLIQQSVNYQVPITTSVLDSIETISSRILNNLIIRSQDDSIFNEIVSENMRSIDIENANSTVIVKNNLISKFVASKVCTEMKEENDENKRQQTLSLTRYIANGILLSSVVLSVMKSSIPLVFDAFDTFLRSPFSIPNNQERDKRKIILPHWMSFILQRFNTLSESGYLPAIEAPPTSTSTNTVGDSSTPMISVQWQTNMAKFVSTVMSFTRYNKDQISTITSVGTDSAISDEVSSDVSTYNVISAGNNEDKCSGTSTLKSTLNISKEKDKPSILKSSVTISVSNEIITPTLNTTALITSRSIKTQVAYTAQSLITSSNLFTNTSITLHSNKEVCFERIFSSITSGTPKRYTIATFNFDCPPICESTNAYNIVSENEVISKIQFPQAMNTRRPSVVITASGSSVEKLVTCIGMVPSFCESTSSVSYIPVYVEMSEAELRNKRKTATSAITHDVVPNIARMLTSTTPQAQYPQVMRNVAMLSSDTNITDGHMVSKESTASVLAMKYSSVTSLMKNTFYREIPSRNVLTIVTNVISRSQNTRLPKKLALVSSGTSVPLVHTLSTLQPPSTVTTTSPVTPLITPVEKSSIIPSENMNLSLPPRNIIRVPVIRFWNVDDRNTSVDNKPSSESDKNGHPQSVMCVRRSQVEKLVNQAGPRSDQKESVDKETVLESKLKSNFDISSYKRYTPGPTEKESISRRSLSKSSQTDSLDNAQLKNSEPIFYAHVEDHDYCLDEKSYRKRAFADSSQTVLYPFKIAKTKEEIRNVPGTVHYNIQVPSTPTSYATTSPGNSIILLRTDDSPVNPISERTKYFYRLKSPCENSKNNSPIYYVTAPNQPYVTVPLSSIVTNSPSVSAKAKLDTIRTVVSLNKTEMTYAMSSNRTDQKPVYSTSTQVTNTTPVARKRSWTRNEIKQDTEASEVKVKRQRAPRKAREKKDTKMSSLAQTKKTRNKKNEMMYGVPTTCNNLVKNQNFQPNLKYPKLKAEQTSFQVPTSLYKIDTSQQKLTSQESSLSKVTSLTKSNLQNKGTEQFKNVTQVVTHKSVIHQNKSATTPVASNISSIHQHVVSQTPPSSRKLKSKPLWNSLKSEEVPNTITLYKSDDPAQSVTLYNPRISPESITLYKSDTSQKCITLNDSSTCTIGTDTPKEIPSICKQCPSREMSKLNNKKVTEEDLPKSTTSQSASFPYKPRSESKPSVSLYKLGTTIHEMPLEPLISEVSRSQHEPVTNKNNSALHNLTTPQSFPVSCKPSNKRNSLSVYRVNASQKTPFPDKIIDKMERQPSQAMSETRRSETSVSIEPINPLKQDVPQKPVPSLSLHDFETSQSKKSISGNQVTSPESLTAFNSVKTQPTSRPRNVSIVQSNFTMNNEAFTWFPRLDSFQHQTSQISPMVNMYTGLPLLSPTLPNESISQKSSTSISNGSKKNSNSNKTKQQKSRKPKILISPSLYQPAKRHQKVDIPQQQSIPSKVNSSRRISSERKSNKRENQTSKNIVKSAEPLSSSSSIVTSDVRKYSPPHDEPLKRIEDSYLSKQIASALSITSMTTLTTVVQPVPQNKLISRAETTLSSQGTMPVSKITHAPLSQEKPLHNMVVSASSPENTLNAQKSVNSQMTTSLKKPICLGLPSLSPEVTLTLCKPTTTCMPPSASYLLPLDSVKTSVSSSEVSVTVCKPTTAQLASLPKKSPIIENKQTLSQNKAKLSEPDQPFEKSETYFRKPYSLFQGIQNSCKSRSSQKKLLKYIEPPCKSAAKQTHERPLEQVGPVKNSNTISGTPSTLSSTVPISAINLTSSQNLSSDKPLRYMQPSTSPGPRSISSQVTTSDKPSATAESFNSFSKTSWNLNKSTTTHSGKISLSTRQNKSNIPVFDSDGRSKSTKSYLRNISLGYDHELAKALGRDRSSPSILIIDESELDDPNNF